MKVPGRSKQDLSTLSIGAPDEIPPYYPTPNPPDSTVAVNTVRYSTLPLENIRRAVDEQTDIYAWIDEYGDPGDYLCHYIAYLGMWYQSMHASEDDEFYCKAAGFIHVDGLIPVEEAAVAAEITLRSTLEYFENLTDLYGGILANSQLEDCVITLTNEDGQSFETVADAEGNFLFEDIEFGVYEVTALAGRYFYFHQEEFILDSHDTWLWIEMEEFDPLEPLTYSQGANLLINQEISTFVLTAAYFPTEMLIPYQDDHLNSVQFTAPDNSDECSSFLFLYRGNPMVENPTSLFTFSLPEFQSGELVEVWMNDIYHLTDEDLQEGLTLAFGIAGTNNNIGYTDNTVANSNGNLVKVGPTWYHADEEFGIQGNWDLKLGFYGSTANVASEDVIENSKISLSNYPNPFNPTTTIQFSIPENSDIELVVYNVKGQKIKTLADKQFTKGTHSVIWDGIDENNSPLSSGLYLYILNIDGNREAINRCLLLK